MQKFCGAEKFSSKSSIVGLTSMIKSLRYYSRQFTIFYRREWKYFDFLHLFEKCFSNYTRQSYILFFGISQDNETIYSHGFTSTNEMVVIFILLLLRKMDTLWCQLEDTVHINRHTSVIWPCTFPKIWGVTINWINNLSKRGLIFIWIVLNQNWWCDYY